MSLLLLSSLKSGAVDDEPVLHITFQHPLISDVDLVGGNHFNIAGDAVSAAEVQHFLRLLDPYN